jgi:hypothetical protein
MAYTPKTLSDLKTSLADRHDSGTVPTDSSILAFYIRWLNKGQAYCADKLRLTKSKDYTTSSGTIALDDDFLVIDRVFLDEVQYAQISLEDVPYKSGSVFWITGNQTDGFALNTPDDDTYTVYYSFKPAEMVADADVCIIPDPEAVVAYAYSFIRKSETDPVGDATSALQECDARLQEMKSARDMNDSPLSFNLQDGI